MSQEKDEKDDKNHKERLHLFDRREHDRRKREIEPDPPTKDLPGTLEAKPVSYIEGRFRR